MKRHYTDEQRRQRLSFANGYKSWTAEQWEHVIFADEKTFEGRGRHRQQRVRRPKGHRFDPKYTKHSHIFAPSHHVIACFSRGPGYCIAYEGRLDGKMLRRMLDQTLVQTAADYYDLEHGESWWFVHDNSPPFKSGEVQNWLHNHGVARLDFPPNSSDLIRSKTSGRASPRSWMRCTQRRTKQSRTLLSTSGRRLHSTSSQITRRACPHALPQ